MLTARSVPPAHLLTNVHTKTQVRKYKFDPDTNDDDVLGACFTPITPLVSTCDEEMDESSRRQVALENEHNRRRLKHWGLPIPDRFR